MLAMEGWYLVQLNCVQFEGAYNLLTDAEEMNEMPTAGMYNAIMSGYFREASVLD